MADRLRSRRRALAGVVVLGVAALAIWAALAAVQLIGVRDDLRRAEAHLTDARGALQDLEPDRARRHLERAAVPLARTADRLGSLPVRAAAGLPVIRPNLLAVEAIARTTADVVGASLAVVEAASGDGDGGDALLPVDGRVPVDAWAGMAPALRDAARVISRASADLAGLSSSSLLEEVATARTQLLDLLGPAADQVVRAAAVAEVIPAMLGADGPRSYFVGASNPAEPRGSGGFIGAWSILDVDDGRMRFAPFRPVQDLPDIGASVLPAPDPSVGERYRRYGGTGAWANLNMTPDFPVAAMQIAQLYAEVTGRAVDGVILVDPLALAALVGPSDEIDVPGIGAVRSSQIVQFLVTDAYARIESGEQRKRLLGQVAARAVDRFLDHGIPADPAGAVERLAGALDGGHVLVHATDPVVQEGLVRLGVAGTFPAHEGDLLAAIANDGSATKLGAFLSRSITHRVVLAEDGTGEGTTQVRLANEVQLDGLPQYVVGPNIAPLREGELLLLLSTYCAASCRVVDTPPPGWGSNPTTVEVELGHPVVSTWVAVPAGGTATLDYGWALADAWHADGGGGRYTLTYRHQPSVAPVELLVEVEVPPGATVQDPGEGWVVEGRTARWEGRVEGDVVLAIPFTSG